MKQESIVVERVYQAPVSRVWQALTDRDEMRQWYFDLKEFRPEIGFRFDFMGGTPEKQYKHLCEVTEVIPLKKLAYSWRYEGYAGISFVSFELTDQGDTTLLRLTHTGIDSFPKENPDMAIGNFRKGWDHLVNVSLREHVEG